MSNLGRNMTRLTLTFTLLLACLAAATPTPVVAQGPLKVTLTAAKDNTLYEDVNGAFSNGSGQHLFAGQTGSGSIRRGLISFDLVGSDIPAGSIIDNVTLSLNMSKTHDVSGPETVGLHRLLADWGEGTSDALENEGAGTAAAGGDATWIHRFSPNELWTAPGGDFAGASSAQQPVDKEGAYSWSSAGMTQDLQRWFDDPTVSFGWLIQGNEGGPLTAKRFDSRQNEIVENRPSLRRNRRRSCRRTGVDAGAVKRGVSSHEDRRGNGGLRRRPQRPVRGASDDVVRPEIRQRSLYLVPRLRG